MSGHTRQKIMSPFLPAEQLFKQAEQKLAGKASVSLVNLQPTLNFLAG
jgi:hypothetical protein